MKITKEEKQYIVDKTNELLDLNSKNISTDLDAYIYYKTDIINAFTKTKRYQEVLKEFKKVGIDKNNIDIDVTYRWKDVNRYPCIVFKVIQRKVGIFDDYITINGVITFIINDKPLTDKSTYYGIQNIDDVRLMEKVILAQDLKVKNKAPEIDKIINSLVYEIKSTYNIENYRDKAIKYIEKNY